MLELAGVTDVPRPARAQLVSSVYALAEASLVAEASIGRDKEAAREAVIRHMQLLRAAIQALGGKIGGGELT